MSPSIEKQAFYSDIGVDCVYTAKMATDNSENCETNSIKITKIDNPHKFWYKFSNDSTENRAIEQLELHIAKYIDELLESEGDEPVLDVGDVVAVFHCEWKWIRGSVEQILNEGEEAQIRLWLIDYGCELTMPRNKMVPIKDPQLAYRPSNVRLGGLSDIVPAKLVCHAFDT